MARGTVRPVTHEPLHLAARLRSGRLVVGQHRLTGREVAALDEPIEELMLSAHLDRYEEAAARISCGAAAEIRRADLICFPMGSFYTSLMACLLPDGVAEAVRDARCPKVYVPNTGTDPEQVGLPVAAATGRLIRQLDPQGAGPCPVDFVLADPRFFLNSSSDGTLLATTLSIAADSRTAPDPDELARDREEHGIKPIFDGETLEVI